MSRGDGAEGDQLQEQQRLAPQRTASLNLLLGHTHCTSSSPRYGESIPACCWVAAAQGQPSCCQPGRALLLSCQKSVTAHDSEDALGNAGVCNRAELPDSGRPPQI